MSYYVTNENSVLNINNAHLKVSGNVMTDVMKLGAIEFAPPASDVGGTVNFTNVTTGVTTSSNLSVGGTLSLGTVEVVATTHTLANTTANGNVTPHTVQFSNATTGIVTTANVEVGGELTVTGNVAVGDDLTVTGNVAVDTDTLVVDSVNNRVGVGTTSPGSLLSVQSTTGNQIRLNYNDDYYNIIERDSSGNLNFRERPGSGAINTHMTIKTGGNVGIGTTDPIGTLSAVRDTVVVGASTYQRGMFYKDGKLQITPPDLYSGYPLDGDFLTTSRYLTDGSTDYTAAALGVAYDTVAGSKSALYFKTAVSGSSLTEKMRITGDGNVGIGTSTPSRILDVHGAARPSNYPFAIGGTSTNRAKYVAVEVSPGVNQTSFTKDFLLGGHSVPGFVRVHAGGSASGSGTLQYALYAEFTISAYGTNFFSNRQSGDSGISIASSGSHNGFTVTINGGTNGSYPRAWIEVYYPSNVYW